MSRPIRKGRPVGVLIATAVLLTTVGALFVPEEPSHPDLQYEPPHIDALRRAMWGSFAEDTVVPQLSFDPLLQMMNTDSVPTVKGPVFSAPADPIVRAGMPYRDSVESAGGVLTDFSIEGAPPGLGIDPTTGVVSGVTDALGRHEVLVSATLDGSARVERRYSMFVDDRRLWLGADRRGRDLLRRIVESGRNAVPPALFAALICVLGGGWLGARAGYRGGVEERLMRFLLALLQGLPPLLVIVLTAVASRMSVVAMMIAVGILLLPETAEGVHARVRALRERDFVEASRELGLTEREILWREIVWHNCRLFLLSRAMQATTFGILASVTVVYVGLTDPNSAQLGTLLVDGRSQFDPHALLFIAPLVWLLVLLLSVRVVSQALASRWSRG